MKNPEIDSRGNKYWINEVDQLHREGDLPAVEYTNGNKWWFLNEDCYRWDEWILG